MDNSFFSQQMPYCLLTLLVYMAQMRLILKKLIDPIFVTLFLNFKDAGPIWLLFSKSLFVLHTLDGYLDIYWWLS